MTVMAAPFTIAFMFLSAATVTVPRRCRGFPMLDRTAGTAGTAVTVAGGDGRDCALATPATELSITPALFLLGSSA